MRIASIKAPTNSISGFWIASSLALLAMTAPSLINHLGMQRMLSPSPLWGGCFPPSLRAERSNPGTIADREHQGANEQHCRILDCFVACAARNDGSFADHPSRHATNAVPLPT